MSSPLASLSMERLLRALTHTTPVPGLSRLFFAGDSAVRRRTG